jgi:hypothetical protein
VLIRDIARVELRPTSAAASPSSMAKGERVGIAMARYGQNALEVSST